MCESRAVSLCESLFDGPISPKVSVEFQDYGAVHLSSFHVLFS